MLNIYISFIVKTLPQNSYHLRYKNYNESWHTGAIISKIIIVMRHSRNAYHMDWKTVATSGESTYVRTYS